MWWLDLDCANGSWRSQGQSYLCQVEVLEQRQPLWQSEGQGGVGSYKIQLPKFEPQLLTVEAGHLACSHQNWVTKLEPERRRVRERPRLQRETFSQKVQNKTTAKAWEREETLPQAQTRA